MEFTKVLMGIAVVAVLLAVGNVFTLVTGPLASTGHASSDTGTADVELQASVHIRFLVKDLDWGAGSVNANPATLNSSDAPFYDGNWVPAAGDGPGDVGPDGTVLNGGLVIENYGSVPVNLSLYLAQNADAFICNGNAGCIADGNQSISWMLSENETGSCTGQLGSHFGSWNTVDTSGSPGTTVCDTFLSTTATNQVELDLQLVIPITAPEGTRTPNIVNAEACYGATC